MADTAWENGKAYTAMLAKAAEDAAQAAAAAAAVVATAKADVAQATRALAAARTAAATWAAVEALAAAEAALAAAVATYEALLVAAEIAAAILAGAILGTLIGQGLRGIWTWAFEVLFLVFRHPVAGGTYVPLTVEETDALMPGLFSIGAGREMTRTDFARLGEPGEAAWNYASAMARAYVNTVRAAATATNGNREDFLENAIPDLQNYLHDLPDIILEFAHHLEVAGIKGGSPELEELGGKAEQSIRALMAKLDNSKPDYAEAEALCGTAIAAMNSATAALGGVHSMPVVGPEGYIPEMTVAEFREFIAACATDGEAALPVAEVALSHFLLDASGIEFNSSKTIGALLAEYDANGDNSKEEALFDPQGSLSLADYLRRTVICHKERGTWLDIDPETSELVISLRTDKSEGHISVASIDVHTFDQMISKFRTSTVTQLKVGPNRSVEIPAKTTIGEVAVTHTGGDVSRLLDANPEIVLPVTAFRSFLSGNNTSEIETIAGARPLASGSGVSSSLGADAALALLLRAISQAMTANAIVDVTTGSPFGSSSTGGKGDQIVLLPPEPGDTSHHVGHRSAEAPSNTIGAAENASGLGAEVLGNTIHGGLPT